VQQTATVYDLSTERALLGIGIDSDIQDLFDSGAILLRISRSKA